MNKNRLLPILAILTATILWGSSFVVTKSTIDDFPPFFLIGIRFLISSVLLSLVFIKKFRNFNKKYISSGFIIGFCLFAAYMFQTFGVMTVTPGENAFLTAVYCVLVPFFSWAVSKKAPDGYNIVSAFMCLLGIGLISLTSSFTINKGSVLTIIGGIFFALQIVSIDALIEDKDPILLSISQFFFCGIFALIGAFLFERGTEIILTPTITLSVIYMILFCSGLPMLLQNVGQKYTPPAAASVLLSLESVFGVMFSIIAGEEYLSVRKVFGFLTIFMAVIISETKPFKKPKKVLDKKENL